MSIRILHSADWQLGRPFASVRDESSRHRLREERLNAVRRIARVVKEKEVQVVLVAGDLFDSPNTDNATVAVACAAIRDMTVPVLVIPGNHDHGGPGSIWEQDFFKRQREQLAPNLVVLQEAAPMVVKLGEGQGELVVLPAPLLRRHEVSDVTSWIRSFDFAGLEDVDAPRVVLAHGTIQGFGSQADEDEDSSVPNYLDLGRLPMAQLDYVALGDWHGMKQVGDKAWYSGTPEPDRFPKGDAYEAGHVLVVDVNRGVYPKVQSFRVGGFTWTELNQHLSGDDGLHVLRTNLEQLTANGGNGHVVKLSLSGSLGLEAMKQLEQLREDWSARLVRLKWDSQVTVAPSDEEIHSLTQRAGDPLVATVARQLVEKLNSSTGEEAEINRLALRELYAICNENGEGGLK